MDDADLIKHHLQLLCTAETTENELEALRLLHLNLANLHISQCDADIIEKQYLTQSKTALEEGNPYPYFEVTELKFPESVALKDFVHYIFTRRYGWSEVMAAGQTHTVQRIGSIGSYSKDEGFMKSHLNELLDELLKWLLCQKFSHELISSLGYTVQLATSYPVIRKQAFIHILEWFKSACTKFEEELFFESSKGLILLGLTDVWSAIRSACASKLNAIADQFSILQMELFYQALVQICKVEGSSWQAKEGAVMGLNVIVRRFQWVGTEGDDSLLNSDTSNTEFYVKFGKEALTSIPEFITSTLHDVIFLLLAHPQLSIRENAIKTFSSYLSRCGLQEAMSLFSEVISALSKGAGLSHEEVAKLDDMSHVVSSTKFSWMDAYLAEGMLGMCIFLVKHVPAEGLLPEWSLCMNILSLYLMHPASTVRQATSKVIKFIVAKDTSNPAILKLVLQSLSSHWLVNADLLSQNCLPENYSQLPESTQLYVNANYSQNVSITSVLSSTSSAGETTNKDRISKTWEWREGRLLAYELIFQFLIKNHWLYTFGASTRSHAHNYSEEHRRSHSPAYHELKPLQTYGGGSLQAAKSSASATAVNGVYNRSLNLREEGCPVSAPITLTHRCRSPDSLQRPQQPLAGNLRDTSLRPSVERTANLPPPRKSLKRRATIDHLNPLTKPMPVRHFPQNDKSNASPKTADGLNSISALPLITTVKRFELSQYEESKGGSSDVLSTGSTDALSAGETEKRKLMAKSEKTSLSELLLSILHQTVECFNSGSWELKRMSQQVLPGLVEILRWYDMSLLVSYWSDNLSTETSVRCYGASLSFLYSVTHAARLSPLFNDPPDNWQDLKACKEEVRKIVDCMNSQLSLYIPMFVKIIKRPTIDKLTVIAVQILLTSSTFIPSSCSSANLGLTTALVDAVDCIRSVTVLNNPGARIQKYKPSNMPNRILLPSSGFLSCNPLDSDQLDVTVNNLQKYLLEHVHTLLVGFVRQAEVVTTYTLLPCLIKFLRGQYATVHTNRSFADSATVIFDKLAPLISEVSDEKFDLSMRKRVYEVKNDSFYELILCVTDKSADKHIIHLALDCLSSLLQHSDSCRYILPLCKAVCSQLCSAQGSSSQSRTTIDGLEIMSNDIRESIETEPTDDSETDDEEAVLLEVEQQESLALQNSGGTTASGRQSGLSQRSAGDASAGLSIHSEGDSGSDWDSWDEQEEETNDKESVFQEFLRKVYQSFQTQGQQDEFHSSLKKLPQSEFRLIKSLLQI